MVSFRGPPCHRQGLFPFSSPGRGDRLRCFQSACTPTDSSSNDCQNIQAAFFDLGAAAITDLLKPYDEPFFPSMEGYGIAAAAGEGGIGPTKMRLMNLKRNELQKAYLDRWNATAADGKPRMDAIICACSPWAAPRLGQTQENFYVGWTGFVNYLGRYSELSANVVPPSTVLFEPRADS